MPSADTRPDTPQHFRQAQAAGQSGNKAALRYAHFLEDFVCHFLTGLFSTGHMRTPRRQLTRLTLVGWTRRPTMRTRKCAMVNTRSVSIKANQYARAMYDKDCANGLWVFNIQNPRSWSAYGESQLFSAKGDLNSDAASDACPLSIAAELPPFIPGPSPRARRSSMRLAGSCRRLRGRSRRRWGGW
jgi:hypothetical protein